MISISSTVAVGLTFAAGVVAGVVLSEKQVLSVEDLKKIRDYVKNQFETKTPVVVPQQSSQGQ